MNLKWTSLPIFTQVVLAQVVKVEDIALICLSTERLIISQKYKK